jgi:FkbM family methyltransferase
MALLSHLIAPGDVVWDVGAHHGYVALLAATCAGPLGRVHAFEPGTRNVRLLRRHVHWNRLGNVVVHNLALAAYTGRSRFGGGATSKMHRLGNGDEDVVVDSGENLVRSGVVLSPNVVKIDVEGSEAEVLKGTLPVLPTGALVLVAMHSFGSYRECTGPLQDRGFDLIPSPALELALHGPWRSDPDLLCIGPDCDRRHRLDGLSWVTSARKDAG